MHTLNVVLVGKNESLLPQVRCELWNQSATIQAEFLDAGSVVDSFRLLDDEMCLFIVHLESERDLTWMRRLSGTFVGRPILAIVDVGADPSLVLKVMRAGAAQIVPLPMQPQDFRAALDCIVVQFGNASGKSTVVAVSGVTGGCGCTTIALNLAYEIAFQSQAQCLLIELALRMGMLASYLGIQPKFTTSDLFGKSGELDSYVLQKALSHICENLDILPGPYQAIDPVAVSPQAVGRLVELARQLATVVVLDVVCTYDDLYFEALSSADSLILVAEQRVPSIRAVDMVRGALGDRNPLVVINHYNPKVPGFSAPRLQELLRVPTLLTVAHDHAVSSALNKGRPIRMESPRAQALADIDSLVREILPTPGAALAKGPSILGRLSRMLNL
jgi:pilus assembly protein CpaE